MGCKKDKQEPNAGRHFWSHAWFGLPQCSALYVLHSREPHRPHQEKVIYSETYGLSDIKIHRNLLGVKDSMMGGLMGNSLVSAAHCINTGWLIAYMKHMSSQSLVQSMAGPAGRLSCISQYPPVSSSVCLAASMRRAPGQPARVHTRSVIYRYLYILFSGL